MEELRLETERQLGDLVQIDRALVRILELPRLPPVRAGERALLVTEELGLEQPRWDRGTVDLDEGTVVASRRGMQGAGDEVLPDAAFAADQDRRIRVGDAFDDGADRPHLRASVEQGDVVGEVALARNASVCQRPVH